MSELLHKCDFCDAQKKFLTSINDGAWAICTSCMVRHYGGCICSDDPAERCPPGQCKLGGGEPYPEDEEE